MTQMRRFVIDRNLRFLFSYLNINEGKVLRKAGIPIDFFERKNLTLTTEEYFNLTLAMVTEARVDMPIPLMLTKMPLTFFSPQIMAALCSPNFAVFARRISKYKPLMGPLNLDIYEDDSIFSITLSTIETSLKLHPIWVASDLAFWVKIIREATHESIIPLKLELKEPIEDKGYEAYFGIPFTSGQQDLIVFKRSDVLKPFHMQNESVWAYFEPEFRKRLDELERDTSFSLRVRSALMELLPLGQSAIGDVSEKLCISTRTLQRRLKSENTSYQKLLNQCRERLAYHYLSTSELSISEISFLLGFEEHSSFSRAFGQWTGSSPERFRAEQNQPNIS